MITKAIIKEKVDNKFKVRIPLFESAGNLNEIIFTATVCYEPGNLEAYNIGDIVFVAFENNEIKKPVIIGKLYLGEEENPRAEFLAAKLNVNTSAVLPANTSIGNITSDELYTAIKNNESFEDRIEQLEKKINDLINN